VIRYYDFYGQTTKTKKKKGEQIFRVKQVFPYEKVRLSIVYALYFISLKTLEVLTR
jgi:hypothetical protein